MNDEPITNKEFYEKINNLQEDEKPITEFLLKVNEKGENTILNIVVLNLDLRNHGEVTSVIQSIKDQFEFYLEFQTEQEKKKVIDNAQNII